MILVYLYVYLYEITSVTRDPLKGLLSFVRALVYSIVIIDFVQLKQLVFHGILHWLSVNNVANTKVEYNCANPGEIFHLSRYTVFVS